MNPKAPAAQRPSTQTASGRFEPLRPSARGVRLPSPRPEESCARRMSLLADEFSSCEAMLIALGDEHRQAIFIDLLRHWGGLRACEIAEHVGLSRPAVSRHLAVMQRAGIVSSRRVKTMRIYHPTENPAPWDMLAHLACEARRFVGSLGADAGGACATRKKPARATGAATLSRKP